MPSSLHTWWWDFLGYTIYRVPEPPPRVRTKPMEVICPGLPRSGTESLQQALLKLGYDYTYHGWDVLFEEPNYMPGWVRLCQKKWYGAPDGESHITAADFDALLGHSTAVTDAASSVFAAEMIAAYPDAKVVLNVRRDLDKWWESAQTNLVGIEYNWQMYLLSWFSPGLFWGWTVYERYLWALLFRGPRGTLHSGITVNGKWVYREHCNMIRGLVPKERLLEWAVEDGWEPLCEFLGKPVPDEPFPRANDRGGFQSREQQVMGLWFGTAYWNLAILGGTIAAGVALGFGGYLRLKS